MIFIDLTAASVPVVQHFEYNSVRYTARIRHSLELTELEKERLAIPHDCFVVHIKGPLTDVQLLLFLGDDLQWHSITPTDYQPDFIALVGDLIDRCYT